MLSVSEQALEGVTFLHPHRDGGVTKTLDFSKMTRVCHKALFSDDINILSSLLCVLYLVNFTCHFWLNLFLLMIFTKQIPVPFLSLRRNLRHKCHFLTTEKKQTLLVNQFCSQINVRLNSLPLKT